MAIINFSIITTNFNDSNLLPRNFNSVNAQSCKNYEHIIVDDFSSDNSLDVIKEYTSTSVGKNILIQHFENLGPAAGVGTGISNAQGIYSTFLSADDELCANTLDIINEIINKDPTANLICGDVIFVDINGNEMKRLFYSSDKPIFFPPSQVIRMMRKGIFIINGGGSFAKISILRNTPFNDKNLKWHCDHLAYSLIGIEFGFWYVPKPLHKFYIGHNNFSSGVKKWCDQKEVIKHSLDLISSNEYNYLKPAIVQSSFFSSYPYILRFLFLNFKNYHEFCTFNLFLNALFLNIFRFIKKFTPPSFINIYVVVRSIL